MLALHHMFSKVCYISLHSLNLIAYTTFAEHFVPLVRMFIGFRRFREMEYVLEILIQHDQFELIVSVCDRLFLHSSIIIKFEHSFAFP